jgi:methyl-accepting chemotaxis protein
MDMKNGPTFKSGSRRVRLVLTLVDWVKRIFGIQWFRNLKIGAKLTLGFVIVAMIAGVIGLVGTFNLYRIDRTGQEVYRTNIAVLGPLHKISAQLLKLRINTVYHVLESEDKFRYEFAIKAARQNIKQELAELKKGNGTVRQQLNSLENAFVIYWQEEASVLKLSNENQTAEATARMDQKLNSLASMIDTIIDGLFTTSDTDAQTKTAVNHSAALKTIGFMLALAVIGIIVSLGLGDVISRVISKPLQRLTAAAGRLADGDVSLTIAAVNAKDETAILTNAFAKMAGSLHKLVSEINEDSNSLYQASQELKNTAGDTGKSALEVATTIGEMARAAAEQANHTNEAVIKTDVLAGLVRKVSAEVGNISAESEKVAQAAILGQQATKDVTNEMVKIYDMTKEVTVVIAELEKTSREITSITAVIQNIAEQTTLLALNAAIEAARAGEHGRGFGVVAQETGKLAEQSKQAAQLIGNLLCKMDQRTQQVVQSMATGMNVVTAGKNLTTEATGTFEQIFNTLGNILKRIDAVALSTQLMVESNEGIVTVMSNIAGISEENMASTQEISAAAEEQSAAVEQVNALAGNLAAISGKLQQSALKFKIG